MFTVVVNHKGAILIQTGKQSCLMLKLINMTISKEKHINGKGMVRTIFGEESALRKWILMEISSEERQRWYMWNRGEAVDVYSIECLQMYKMLSSNNN